MSWTPETRYEALWQSAVAKRLELLVEGSDEEALRLFVSGAAEALDSQEASTEQMEGAQLKLDLILDVAARYKTQAEAEGRFLSVREALSISLTRLCPLWPFC